MNERDNEPKNRPQPIAIWLESLGSSQSAATPGKDEAILALLAKLALHYWRPDFTEGQAKQLYSDYLDDLMPFAVRDIADAISEYRQDGRNKFYPTSGQIIDLILGKARLEAENPGAPDRARTLQRMKTAAIGRGHAEAEKMQQRIASTSPRALESRLPVHPERE